MLQGVQDFFLEFRRGEGVNITLPNGKTEGAGGPNIEIPICGGDLDIFRIITAKY